MKADKQGQRYAALRGQPLWKLLASDNSASILAILEANLFEDGGRLASSIFHERVANDIAALNTTGADLRRSAQEYVAEWLVNGYLERRFLPGQAEEHYELSAPAAAAIRFVQNLDAPYSAATESRLSVVIEELVKLAQDSDPNTEKRVQRLIRERQRIDEDIEAVRRGDTKILPAATAYERAREIIALANGLIGDFRRVRDEFEHLHRDLRQKILEDAPSRSTVLEALFAGIDLIADSPSGRTFSAFWRLLTDPSQSTAMDGALEEVLTRDFAKDLDVKDRRFLMHLTGALLTHGGAVHNVSQNFAKSLKHFVASREYLEQRRLQQILKKAQREALAAKESIKPTQPIGQWLELTSSRVRSASQWTLFDASTQATPSGMIKGEAAGIDLEMIGELVARSEIDFRSLKQDIVCLLDERGQVSISEVLDRFPARQGLGSVVGLLTLGSRYGMRAQAQVETVHWTGGDTTLRSARIPKFYFLTEKAHELT